MVEGLVVLRSLRFYSFGFAVWTYFRFHVLGCNPVLNLTRSEE